MTKQRSLFLILIFFILLSNSLQAGELAQSQNPRSGKSIGAPSSKAPALGANELLDTLFTGANPNRCRMQGNVLADNSSQSVYDCVELWSGAAETSFESECGGAVTKDLLMCIFLREQRGRLEENNCSVNGCGLAQMTSIGAKGVQQALLQNGAIDSYRQFFINIGRPDLADVQPRFLGRESALNMQQSVGMAAALLCQKYYEGARTQSTIAERYNGNSNKNIRIPYRNFVSQCIIDFKDGSIDLYTRTGGEIKRASSRLQTKYFKDRRTKQQRIDDLF